MADRPVIHHVGIDVIDNVGGIFLTGGPAVNQVRVQSTQSCFCDVGPVRPYGFYNPLGEVVMLTAVELEHRRFGRHPGGQNAAHSHPYFIPEDTKWRPHLMAVLCYII